MSIVKYAHAAIVAGLVSTTAVFACINASAEEAKIGKATTPAAIELTSSNPETVKDEPRGNSFLCQDGSRMILDFQDVPDGVNALVTVHGQSYSLPHYPLEPGVARIVWSDGDSSLTWSTGVSLMWMSGATHLMCGRSHHH